MRNFRWQAFKTKKEATEFKKTKGNSSKMFNLKSEKDKLERLGRSECLAAYFGGLSRCRYYQDVDKGYNWIVEWTEFI